MGKKERLTEFNRNNILLAAKELFTEKGVVQTTVDDIARKADYSKSTVYVYFTSKEDIFNYTVLEHIQIFRETIAETIRQYPGFPEGYFAICDALAKFYADNPLCFESILGEIRLPENESDAVLERIYAVGETINEILGEYIRSGISSNKASVDMPPLQATFTLWASIGGIILLANKKEPYIQKAMGIGKEEFMRDGFALLLKSIQTGGAPS